MWLIIYCEGEHEKLWLNNIIKKGELSLEHKIKIIPLGKEDKTNYDKINKFIKNKQKYMEKNIRNKRVAKHYSKPKEFVIVDADEFRGDIKTKPDHYFFSQPCLEVFLLDLFNQKPKSKTNAATLKKQFNSFVKKEFNIENKVKNIGKIYQKAVSKKLIAKTLAKDYAICKLINNIKKIVEEK